MKDTNQPPVSGTRSMLGPQCVSTRASAPAAAFTRGGRTDRLSGVFEAAQLGRASPGPAHDVRGALGRRQPLSQFANAPACGLGVRGGGGGGGGGGGVGAEARRRAAERAAAAPGPFTYETSYQTVGERVMAVSRITSAPATRIGREARFKVVAAVTAGALPLSPQVPVGFLGNAPRWSFGGGRARRAAPALLVSAAAATAAAAAGTAARGGNDGGGAGALLAAADAPSFLSAPAPGAYPGAARSSFGPQVSSEAAAAPAARVPRAARDAVLKMAMGRAEASAALTGRATLLAPALAQVSSLGRQALSVHRSSGAPSFGTSGRFCSSERAVAGGGGGGGKKAAASTAAGDKQQSGPSSSTAAAVGTPGPGAYVV